MFSVDSMINGFPVPALPKIEGRPTYDTITALETEISLPLKLKSIATPPLFRANSVAVPTATLVPL
jgi:hypothetical protein